jgi:hypothetical protein
MLDLGGQRCGMGEKHSAIRYLLFMESESLYETDFFLWTIEQAEALREMARAGSNARVDWENVAEEIESLGKSDRRSLASHIRTIIEHLMKLAASSASDPRDGWVETVFRARSEIGYIIDDSPSLCRQVPELIERETPRARKLAASSLRHHGEQARTPLDSLTYTEDQVLGDWLP